LDKQNIEKHLNIEEFFRLEKFHDNPEEIPTDIFAYIGDSFFNLVASIESVGDGRIKANKANREGVKYKRASAQRELMKSIVDTLSEDEERFFKKGLNSQGAKKRGNDYDYRWATGFETLIGYLFIMKRWERLSEIFRNNL